MMIVAARRLIQRGTRRTASNHSGRSSGCVPAYPAADRMAIWPLKATVKAISQAANA